MDFSKSVRLSVCLSSNGEQRVIKKQAGRQLDRQTDKQTDGRICYSDVKTNGQSPQRGRKATTVAILQDFIVPTKLILF